MTYVALLVGYLLFAVLIGAFFGWLFWLTDEHHPKRIASLQKRLAPRRPSPGPSGPNKE